MIDQPDGTPGRIRRRLSPNNRLSYKVVSCSHVKVPTPVEWQIYLTELKKQLRFWVKYVESFNLKRRFNIVA